MEENMKILIAVGASFTANCQPCLNTAISHALTLGVTKKELLEAIGIGKVIRKGAIGKMDHFASTLLNNDINSSSECPFGSTDEDIDQWIKQDQ